MRESFDVFISSQESGRNQAVKCDFSIFYIAMLHQSSAQETPSATLAALFSVSSCDGSFSILTPHTTSSDLRLRTHTALQPGAPRLSTLGCKKFSRCFIFHHQLARLGPATACVKAGPLRASLSMCSLSLLPPTDAGSLLRLS